MAISGGFIHTASGLLCESVVIQGIFRPDQSDDLILKWNVADLYSRTALHWGGSFPSPPFYRKTGAQPVFPWGKNPFLQGKAYKANMPGTFEQVSFGFRILGRTMKPPSKFSQTRLSPNFSQSVIRFHSVSFSPKKGPAGNFLQGRLFAIKFFHPRTIITEYSRCVYGTGFFGAQEDFSNEKVDFRCSGIWMQQEQQM